MTDRQTRRATPDDIVGYLARAGRPVSHTALQSGMGLGDGQYDIPAAIHTALQTGLIRVLHTEPGPLHIPYKFYVPAEVSAP